MNKHYLLVILYYLICHETSVIYGQGCPSTNIILSSQQEIDDFLVNYPSCTVINGDLIIQETNPGDIVNLDGLANIEMVGGTLGIFSNESLNDLTGLNNLFAIGFSLFVESNSSLQSFSGLENLTIISGALSVRGNNNLERFTGLSGITVLGDLFVAFNGLLENFEGLNNLVSASTLTVIDNGSLIDFSGLSQLSNIGSFLVSSNFSLTSFNGLNNLTTIQNLSIDFNDDLQSLSGLENVGTLIDLYLDGNILLTDISALENINPTLLTNLTITFNDLLSTCAISAICTYLEDSNHSAMISNNGVSCNSRSVVETACAPPSPDCQVGPTFFSSQSQIDNFPIQYPDCKNFFGSITIFNAFQISNLDGFSQLETITGDLVIRNTNISDISGLSNLQTVGGDLNLYDNDNITSLSGLSSLRSVGGFFQIYDNDQISNLAGLEQLESVGENFTISINDKINSIAQLTSLTTIGGGLTIGNTPLLTNLTGLEQITELNGLLIVNNPSLTSLKGLESVQRINRRAWIRINPALENLSALRNLTLVNVFLSIEDNDRLVSLDGLENLSTINGGLELIENDRLTFVSSLNQLNISGLTNLTIQENPSLSSCTEDWICNYVNANPGQAVISNNDQGCSTLLDIQSDCSTTPVTWEYFAGEWVNETVALKWATASEWNNRGFEVQRSGNGITWHKLGFVEGHGTTTTPHKYHLVDKSPLQGENYYRILQLDWDGHMDFSSVVLIENKFEMGISVFPNPTNGMLYIKSGAPVPYFIYNTMGQLVKSGVYVEAPIDMTLLPASLYELKVDYNGQTIIKRILKK